MDLQNMTYKELSDEYSEIRKLIPKVRIIITYQDAQLDSLNLKIYRCKILNNLLNRKIQLVREINRRADRIPMEVVENHL